MHKHRNLLAIFGIAILLAAAGLLVARISFASETVQDRERPIRVAIKEIQPFVFKAQDRFTGFSIDMWREVAFLSGMEYEFVEVETVHDQLNAVRSGDADLAIAAISMTPEREEEFDFSYPYYLAGLQILTTGKPISTLESLLAFLFSSRFLVGLIVLFIILVIVGHIVWLVERNKNPDFPHSYVKGIWEGIWWAAATVTTVGYGDRTVKDKFGRIVGIIWMFAGLFLIANFTAFVTAEVTATRLEASIQNVDDLHGRSVVTLFGTTSADYLLDQRIPFRGVETVEEAYAMLDNEEVEAMVYDAPVLQYHVAASRNRSLIVVGSPFESEYYGIALHADSPLKEPINKALLEIRQNGTHDELLAKWYLADDN